MANSDTSGLLKRLRIGTRGSLLARTQTGQVVELIRGLWAGLDVQTITISSSGDRIQDKPLHEFGGKGLFTKELEQAMLDGQIDLAVHSLKDLPVTMPLVDVRSLVFVTPEREDPRDLLVSRKAKRVEDLPNGAKVGTGSLRRRCQLLALRPDLVVEMIRGNIDTRIRKLREGQYDAVILATAGVKRAGLLVEEEMTPIPVETMLPAAGQAALALQYRKDDEAVREIVAPLVHRETQMAVEAERGVVLGLGGDCHSPIAAYATIESGEWKVESGKSEMTLRAVVGERDGAPPVKRAMATGSAAEAKRLVEKVVGELR